MILRVVRFELSEQDEPGYMDHIRRLAPESVAKVDGLVQFRMVRSASDSNVSILGMSVWRDYSALDAFFEKHLDRPLLVDPTGNFVRSPTIEHFECVLTVRAERADEARNE